MTRFLTTKERFNKNLTTLPFAENGPRPLPTRNLYALFNDGGHDLFRHGLSEVSPASIEGGTGMPLESFRNTADYSPFGPDNGNSAAKEDPVMFGFDLIIRTQESPLFSSVIDESVQKFFDSNIVTSDEMVSRKAVWESFKKTFFQFFRSNLDTQPLGQSADPDNPVNSRFYYYLTKVTGLDGLVEANTMETANSFVDYGKDMIKLDFTEDVTLRVGRMAALYKSLYWSRMSGKTMIPENLLRFDCDIIVSEVRNFVKLESILNKNNTQSDVNGDGAVDNIVTTDINGLLMLRDNVNRYVYTLYDCQLFFDKMPHGDIIDLATQPAAYEGYSVGFTYKHSTMRVDVFDPIANAYGSLNNGSYNPFAVTPFDRFLNYTIPISSTNSTIGEAEVTSVPKVIIDVVTYNYEFTDVTLGTPPAPKKTSDGMGTDSDGKAKSKIPASGAGDGDPSGPPEPGNDINSVKTDAQSTPNLSNKPRFQGSVGSIGDIKNAMTNSEIDNYKEGKRLSTITNGFGERGLGWEESQNPNKFKEITNAMTNSEVDNYKEGKRLSTMINGSGERGLGWEESKYPNKFKENNDAKSKEELDKINNSKSSSTPSSFKEKNATKSKEELDSISGSKSSSTPSSFRETNLKNSKGQLDSTKSGAPKESWLKSDSPGARFAKRIVNTGIAAVNQVIAKRTALLTKTLNTMASSAGYNSMLPPTNIYQSEFNGELYLASKMVRDSFENFVGESISNLFNKAKRPL